jgi:hypothetical protein
MGTLAAQVIVLAGVTPSLAAASAGGDQWANTGREYLHIKNAGGSSIDVTVNSQKTCNQGFDHDVTVAVPNGEERLVGPFPKERFNDENGYAQVSYSDVTSVTIGVFRLP